jgi:N6-L-threonylcarbamoyladenine synthase
MLLAIETSCDETSVAVVHEGRVLSSVVSSQVRLHAEYGGVVPELASREHLRNLLPVARAALTEAGIHSEQLTGLAATQGPGLPSALMVGFQAAQSAAFVLNKPFLGIHHHEAHLYSPWIVGSPPASELSQMRPSVSLIVSGGHTMLVHVKSLFDHSPLGSTLDDAAGECFDKVAKLAGLPYPGGPEIDRLSTRGDAARYDFPRPLLNDPGFDFSFSGLKTAVRYFLRDNPKVQEEPQGIFDLCASVQAAIVEVLVAKTTRAAKKLGVNCITASGGVTCNSSLRRALAAAAQKHRFELRLAEKRLCTDNAAMVGILAEAKLRAGAQARDYTQEIRPGWVLA